MHSVQTPEKYVIQHLSDSTYALKNNELVYTQIKTSVDTLLPIHKWYLPLEARLQSL